VTDSRVDDLVTTVIILECFDTPECLVSFEPEGAQHTLLQGDWFRVEAVLPRDREIEVAYHPGGISIQAEQTWGTRAFNKAGEPLQL
jgi:hypothetical protein